MWIPLSLSYLKVCLASWMCRFMFFIKFGTLAVIIFKNNFPAPFSFLILGFPLCLCYARWYSTDFLDSLFKKNFFFLFIKPENLKLPILRFICSHDLIFYLFKSAVEPLLWIFNLHYCTFQIQNFYLIAFL